MPAFGCFAFFRHDDKASIKSVLRTNGDEIIVFAGSANETTVFCNENGELAT